MKIDVIIHEPKVMGGRSAVITPPTMPDEEIKKLIASVKPEDDKFETLSYSIALTLRPFIEKTLHLMVEKRPDIMLKLYGLEEVKIDA